jgi:hypothetical protein
MNRNKIFIISGALIAVLLVAVLFILQFIQGTIADTNENAYTIEIENCTPVAQKEQLDIEIAAIFSSTELKSNAAFLTPIVKINKLNGISTPAFGMNYVKNNINPLMYLYDSRTEDESLFFKSYVQSNSEFVAFKTEAEKGSKNEITVSFDPSNLTTQFFIASEQKEKIDNTKKVFNSLQSLRAHLDELIKSEKIKKGSIVKVYYLCGGIESLMDDDGDGVTNNKDKCPKDKGETNNDGCPDKDEDGVHDGIDQCIDKPGDKECFGCKCPPPPPCPGDADDDKDGVCNRADKCPKDFGNFNGCPDNDRDGFLNAVDKCINVAGDCNGCPCPEPDKDKDGISDRADKCPDKYGTNSDGCPLDVGLIYDDENGTFTLTGINSTKEIISEIEIEDRTGKKLNRKFDAESIVYPTKSEGSSLTIILKNPIQLKITFTIKDVEGNVLLKKTYEKLSLVCRASGDKACGFIDTSKK